MPYGTSRSPIKPMVKANGNPMSWNSDISGTPEVTDLYFPQRLHRGQGTIQVDCPNISNIMDGAGGPATLKIIGRVTKTSDDLVLYSLALTGGSAITDGFIQTEVALFPVMLCRVEDASIIVPGTVTLTPWLTE